MDKVWESVIAGLQLDLKENLSAPILAGSFRKFADYEARNACKIDSSDDLPAILRSNGMFPLPIENGKYQLVRGEGFHGFEPIVSPIRVFESKLEYELATSAGSGESVFVHYVYNTGLLSDFAKANDLWKTNEGRFFAEDFSFMVGKVGPIHQKGTQIQIDGLFEGRDSIVAIEAKTKQHPDFLVRQLYYPYRHWRIKSEKNVKSLFLSVDIETKIYSFWQYNFTRPNDYTSIELERCDRFIINEKPRNEKELDSISADPKLMDIPQANNVETICSIPQLVAGGSETSIKLAEKIGFEPRQALYYTEAAEQLGLVERVRGEKGGLKFVLTSLGTEVVQSRPDHRNEIIVKQMMRLPIMRVTLDELNSGPEGGKKRISKKDIAIRIHENSHLNMTTSNRRAATIWAWFAWMSSHYGMVQFKDGLLMLHRVDQTSLESF